MKLEFADEVLERLAYDSSATTQGWSTQYLTQFRRTLFVVQHASNVRDLKNMRALAFRVETGEFESHVSVSLSGGPRLLMEVSEVPPTATIIHALDEE